jgi:hypothetical protein
MKDRINKAIAATEIALNSKTGQMFHNYLARIRELLIELSKCEIKQELTDKEIEEVFHE